MSVLAHIEPLIVDVQLNTMLFYENFDEASRNVFKGAFADIDYSISRIITQDPNLYFYTFGDIVIESAFGSVEYNNEPHEIVVVNLYGIDQNGECEPYEVSNIFEFSLYRLAVVVCNNPDVNFDGHRVKRWLLENKVTVPLAS